MPELTPRLGIKKPLGNETVTRAAFNENWDIIDGEVATSSELTSHKGASTLDHPDGSVTDVKIGPRTITEVAPASDTAQLGVLLNNLAQRIIAITGKADWKTNPAGTLETLFGTGNVTQPQFDNTTKLATTAFVKQNAGQFSGTLSINAAITLTAATSAGKHILCFGVGPYNVTLPAANSVPNGTSISFFATTQVSIIIQGTDRIQFNNAGQATSLTLQSGDTLTLDSDGSGIWYPVSGSAQMIAAGVIVSSGVGWTKFSDGTMIQYSSSSTSSDGSTTVTFPLNFAGGFKCACANEMDVSGWGPLGIDNPSITVYGTRDNFSNSSMLVRGAAWQTNKFVQVAGMGFYWIAIGRWK